MRPNVKCGLWTRGLTDSIGNENALFLADMEHPISKELAVQLSVTESLSMNSG